MSSDKQSDEVLIERAVKMTFQLLFDEGLFDKYDNADEVMKDCLLIEVSDRRRLDLN